jgi:Rha family phage regulatory protein
MAAQSPCAPAPIVTISANHAVTTSKVVAEYFHKQHKNVLRDIENLLLELPADHRLNFEPMIIDIEIGKGATRKFPAYQITRDGFTLLAMGFTGKEALQWKVRFIEAFNAMERELAKSKGAPSLMDKRWLISFDHTGKECVTPVPTDACVMSIPQVLKAITDPNGLMLSPEVLIDFISAALQRLSQHMECHKSVSDGAPVLTAQARQAPVALSPN